MSKLQDDLKARSDRITSSLSLIDLRVRHLSADLLFPAPSQDIDIFPTVTPEMARAGKYVFYEITYDVMCTDVDGRDIISVKAIISLVLALVSDEVEDADLVAFGSLGALTIAHPYVRELLHNLTGRMGLPPLLLDVMPPEPAPASIE